MSTQHREYEREQNKLDETISVIDSEITQLREEIREATDDYVKQVVNYNKAKDLRYLEDHGRDKPYFGRVDFMKDEVYELDCVYIGKRGIVRSDTFDSVVVDWRAPIASLYYSGESKDAFYRMGREIVRGEVTLKRNFAIEDGKITGIYDGAVKETINREMGHPDDFLQEGFIDEFLAANLNQANDSRLKDIVATIQSEQNDIIRAEKERPIVVQGVAGSGKTTIALHRLSYLIYNYQDSMMSKKFMVFAPNRMFLTYISEVLPELGVDDVQQATFVDWAARLVKPLMPKGWRIISPDKPLQLFFEEGQDERQQKIARHRLRFKGSLACRVALQKYIDYVIETRIPFKKLSFLYNKTKQVFSIPGDFIRQSFFEHFSNMPYHRRLDSLRKHLKQEMNKQLFSHLREKKMDLDKAGLAKFEKMLEQILDTYLTSFPRLETFAAYREIMSSKELLRLLIPSEVGDEVIDDVVESSTAILSEERMEAEDIAPILYLHHLIEGMDKAEHFDHTVVDEAQDLSALEIAVIALATKRHSLTIVGDIAQGIHSYRGIHAWEELTQGIFDVLRPSYFTLSQSYRSTIEIMKCANEVLRQIELPETVLAKPVLRHGDKPIMVTPATKTELWSDISSRVNEFTAEGFKTVAIVTKTIGASKKAFKGLQDTIPNLTLLSSKDNQFPGGAIVMPAYLTKGLQFDVVILLDVDTYLDNEWDAKLLYVAMTRPVHRLVMSHLHGSETPLLRELPTEMYTKE
ncbi:HelD family protein [Brevibacillus sp. NRS-1366]|uniref:HelD family protein n=1 Tax=Brevibacillus sp. NRS-1366 TaxID=3233899 RepID=UPI003D258DE3